MTASLLAQLFLVGAFGVLITVVSTGRWHGGPPAWRDDEENDRD